ncbi:uncharacterized protein EDB93DRAFT_576340 [Suillus bovinus]|uniref:uncharacterized protein n=1 Tax=Suillus bovinus TaxID=48563 RepID=UPI001B868F5E|nr:uncharacterized protein EDB93DRAFT_576340 [Suillus bovinus]KAG2143492.1 hypothetical protein EDB93DRAFT_576340 [Suillus bovinus]
MHSVFTNLFSLILALVPSQLVSMVDSSDDRLQEVLQVAGLFNLTPYDDVPRSTQVGVGFDATYWLLFSDCVETDSEGSIMDSPKIVAVATSEPSVVRPKPEFSARVRRSRFCAVCNQAHQYLSIPTLSYISSEFQQSVSFAGRSHTKREFPSRTALFWCPYPRVE